MKKSIFLSIVGAIVALTMTFVSCSEKKVAENTEEAVVGTDYVVVTTPEGAKGLKKGETVLFEPKAGYTAISSEGGMFVAVTESGQALIDPETGYEKLSCDTLIWKSFYFEAKRGENFIIYVPAYKCQFAAQAYDVKGAYAIAAFGGKITIYKDGKALIEPTGDFAKIAVLPDGKLLVLDGKTWGIATIKDNAIVPGSAATPKDLKKFKGLKGWDEKSPVMILE